jgi:hypothetical protein
MDVVDRLVIGVALLFWIATAVKVAELRSASTPASRTLALTLASVATSAMLLTSSVHRFVGELTGVANLAEPLGRTALLVAAFGGQVLLLRLTSAGPATPRVAKRVPAFAVALVLLWSLFLAAPVDAATLRFTSRFGEDPRVAAYLAVSMGYLAVALVDIVRQARRYGAAASGPLATGLHLIGWGSIAGLGYVAVKVAAIVALRSDVSVPVEAEAAVGRGMAAVAGVLVVTGSTWPAVCPKLEAAARWVRAYRDLGRLYPLWADLLRAHPELALDPALSAWRDRMRLRDVEFRLYRRVIEIRDALLVMRGEVGDDAGGTRLPEVVAIVSSSTQAGSTDMDDTSAQPAGQVSDWAAERDWMVRVAGHYKRARRRRHLLAGAGQAKVRETAG